MPLPPLPTSLKALKDVLNLFQSLLPKDGVLPGKDKRQFEQFVEPAFKAVSRYHIRYTEIFGDAIHIISDYCFEQHGVADCDKLTDNRLKSKIVKHVYSKRRKDEYSRDFFRNNLTALIGGVDNTHFKKFVLSCADYFVLEPDINTDFAILDIDGWVEGAELRGGDGRYDSPASLVVKRLKRCDSVGDLRTVLIGARSGLDSKYRVLLQVYLAIEGGRRMW